MKMTTKNSEELKNFKDDRCNGGLQDCLFAFKCLDKLVNEKFDKLTDKEMVALYDVASLAFDNYYGEEIPGIGHLTTVGKREIFTDYSDEIIKKSEHIIKLTLSL